MVSEIKVSDKVWFFIGVGAMDARGDYKQGAIWRPGQAAEEGGHGLIGVQAGPGRTLDRRWRSHRCIHPGTSILRGLMLHLIRCCLKVGKRNQPALPYQNSQAYLSKPC